MVERVTLKDIATELGLSHATVSRALSDHRHVSHATKDRVRKAAQRLGYVVDASARILRGEPSNLVGLVIPDVQNSFFMHAAKIAAEALALRNYRMVLCVTEDDPERERRDLTALLEARVAGVILVLSAHPLHDTLQLAGRMNVVQLLRRHRRVASDAVRIEDREATYQATRHLIELGHRHLGYIGNPVEPETGSERLGGFTDACEQANLRVASEHIKLGKPRPQFGSTAIAQIMATRRPPTGIVTGGVEQVLGVLQWMNENGVRCPEQVSLVGFGDSPWFELVSGGVTTVHLPVGEVASSAVNLLTQRIANRAGAVAAREEPTIARFSCTLRVRGTSGPPPVDRRRRS